ncbi:MAG: hypothetical protein JNL87_05600 [Burkholderiaceae bacterium]|nr:hypothetical protein [Burkholderiaceae bacterium]
MALSFLALSCRVGMASAATLGIPLGDAPVLERIFAYPNKPDPSLDLAGTIEHYLRQSLARDGFAGASVRVVQDGNGHRAELTADSPDLARYGERLPGFLRNGRMADEAFAGIQDAGQWNPQWRVYLPLGLPLARARSVQLLHFPPDYSLSCQDYLGSRTSRRWEALLLANGAPQDSLARHEAIVDIVPIAAPADSGNRLPVVPFRGYAKAQLQLLTAAADPGGDAHTLPVLAYGQPVRQWVNDMLGQDLQRVLDTRYVELQSGRKTPLLVANHPSYFWRAWEESPDKGRKVMQEDLVAACWQKALGDDPGADIRATLSLCQARWQARPEEVCVLTRVQACGDPWPQAESQCRQSPQSPPACAAKAPVDASPAGSQAAEAASAPQQVEACVPTQMQQCGYVRQQAEALCRQYRQPPACPKACPL